MSIQASQNTNHSRHVGFEIEYNGLTLDQVAKLILQHFNGRICKESSQVYTIQGTSLGDFKLEIDAKLVQTIAKKTDQIKDKGPDNNSIIETISIQIGEAFQEISVNIAPYEIIAPPIPVESIPELDGLINSLRKAGGKGTKESFHHAFGLHINPEVLSTETSYLVKHLQSFLLLEPWLREKLDIDVSRRLVNYIDPFSQRYRQKILKPDYKPSLEDFIKDYYTSNPTRNRSLDMLPVFAHLDKSLVRDLWGKKEKISPRPTFHYRLPNCELSNIYWSLKREWDYWLKVETLANDEDTLTSLMKRFQKHAHWLNRLLSGQFNWVKIVDQYL